MPAVAEPQSVWVEAAEKGDTQVVGELLAQSRSAAASAFTESSPEAAAALHAAARQGHAAVVAQLIAAGVAVDVQDERWDCPLHAAGN